MTPEQIRAACERAERRSKGLDPLADAPKGWIAAQEAAEAVAQRKKDLQAVRGLLVELTYDYKLTKQARKALEAFDRIAWGRP